MERKVISRQQAISDLRELFGLPAEGKRQDGYSCSFCSEIENDTATFFIDKKHFERYEVLQKLSEYFADKVIDSGRCRINKLTFVVTIFWIEPVKKEEKV